MTIAAIFDLDGTLIDTPNAIVTMMRNALGQMGAPVPADAAIRSMIGLPLEAGAAHVLGVTQEHPDVPRLVALYRKQFLDWMVPQSRSLLFAGVSDGLAELQQSGIMIGLATSKYHSSAEAVLQSAGIREFFSVVAGADSVARPKPDPEMARFVAAGLNRETADCVMIGDTVHDLNMGASAGMRTIGVTYGVGEAKEIRGCAPAAIAAHFAEVVMILKSIASERKTLISS